jgi:hypothetical protein
VLFISFLGGGMNNKEKSIRILPMSSEEFKGQTYNDVQSKFFLSELPFDNCGCYKFRKRGLDAENGTVVLFQFNARIIASALFDRREDFSKPDKQYCGALYFNVNSIRTFDPVEKELMQEIWPQFKGFSNAMRELNVDFFELFEKKLTGVKFVKTRNQRVKKSLASEYQQITKIRESIKDASSIEVDRITKARVGQGKFREELIEIWGCCPITKCDEKSLLRASHIKPWRSCEPGEHLDPNNGLLLIANFDVLFDQGFISFDQNGKIIISKMLTNNAKKAAKVHGGIKLELARDHQKFMEYHRTIILK